MNQINMKKLIIIILTLISISCNTNPNKINSKCIDRNGKPYLYTIHSKYLSSGWTKTSEEIIYLDNGSIKYYDEYRGWTVLSEYAITNYYCD